MLSLSADGNKLAVAAGGEDSLATGINGDQGDNSAGRRAISLSADGNTLAVGALRESSAATGIYADQNDNLANESGAVYVY